MFESLARYHPDLPDVAQVAALLVGALLAWWIVMRFIVAYLHVIAERTQYTWDDALIAHRVPSRLAQLVPGYIFYAGVGLLPFVEDRFETLLLSFTKVYMMLAVAMAITAALSAANAIYESNPVSRQRPIKGFVQLLQLVVLIIAVIFIISTLLDQSPLILLSGFGAATAVILLVFRDTILSFVASIQLTAQDMVRVGDWIEVPQFGADGDVIDLELHTVKVQNWDKTITTIPTHRLISDSFKNWRGMSSSGGRRIKRSLFLDTSSIRFLSDAEAESFRRFELLRDYLEDKQGELAHYNTEQDVAKEDGTGVNLRRLTNIGTFRAYALNYLRHHPRIHPHMTLMVRQLPSGPTGLPLELYCFTNTTEWGVYESIQGDIFDHLLAIVPEFGLRVFQEPAGSDVVSLAGLGAGQHLTRKRDDSGSQ